MITNNYEIGKSISDVVKHNIAYDRTQILNFVCANYVNDILNQSITLGFNIDEEQRMKLLVVIDKLLK